MPTPLSLAGPCATYRARTTAAPLPPHRRRRSALKFSLRPRDSRRSPVTAAATAPEGTVAFMAEVAEEALCETSDSCEPGWRRQWRRQWKARRRWVVAVARWSEPHINNRLAIDGGACPLVVRNSNCSSVQLIDPSQPQSSIKSTGDNVVHIEICARQRDACQVIVIQKARVFMRMTGRCGQCGRSAM